MHARLVILRGEATPLAIELEPDCPITLGRSRDNTVILHDEHASRHHARIYHNNGTWLIRDCGTRNGTRVDSARILTEAALRDGYLIDIADMRLRFEIRNPDCAPDRPLPALLEHGTPLPPNRTLAEAGHNGPNGLPDSGHTTLLADELAALHEFMTTAVKETDAGEVIRRALFVVAKHTRATVAGFLCLDEEEPLPKLVYPQKAKVDFALSRQLTQRVQESGHGVWLKAGVADLEESDSLMPFLDAVCVPLMADETPLGALHMYCSGRYFSERQFRFCEVLAGYAANSLARLRLCRSLQAENERLRARVPASDQIVGTSAAIQQLHQLISRAAPCRSTVLVQGETGAGKDLVALAVHRQSPRRNGPLVVANCSAIAPTLLEAELFGHTKGSFSGAIADRPGLFEQADDGTLFLDEIGDMTADCQAKVLRVLDGKGFRRVGGTEELTSNVRLIAATHKDLAKEVRAGRFRQDLYYRLCVLVVHVPPLREHREDIPALVEHFLDRFAPECGQRKKVSEAALRRLVEYSWPGNVRELRTVMENAIMMSDGNAIEVHDLRLHDEPVSGADLPLSLNLEHVEAWAIKQALTRTRGNVSRAARILGVARETLATKLKKYGINRDDCVDGSE